MGNFLTQTLEKARLLLPENRRMRDRSQYVIEKYNLQGWFRKVPAQRLYLTSIIDYIRRNVRQDAQILETGCGIGRTFVLLARVGFRNFIGIENDGPTCRAADEFLKLYGLHADLHHADGLDALECLKGKKVDVYLPLNWTYMTPAFNEVFAIGRKALTPGGLMVVDVIRDDFICSSAKEVATYARYLHKYSLDQVRQIAARHGFDLISFDERFGARVNVYLRARA